MTTVVVLICSALMIDRSALLASRGEPARLLWKLAAGSVVFLAFTVWIAWPLSAINSWSGEAILLSWLLFYFIVFVTQASGRILELGGECIRTFRALDTTSRTCITLVLVYVSCNLIRIYVLPPLNIDSYHIHLARAYEWFYNFRIAAIPNYTRFANTVPPNIHILLATWLKIIGADTLIEALSLFCSAGLYFVTVGILTEMNFSTRSACVTALFLLAMPILIVCAITTQVDLPTLFFLATTFYFLFCCLREPVNRNIIVLGLSLGLLAGAKPQGLVLAGLSFAAASVILFVKRSSLKSYILLGALLMALAAPPYLFNRMSTGVWMETSFSAGGFSLAKLWVNVSHDYPSILFWFPLNFLGRAHGVTLTYFDHDESNYGPGFTVLLIGGIAVALRRLHQGRTTIDVGAKVVGAISGLFLLFMAASWKELYYRWEVRVLSYGAYGASLVAASVLREWFETREARRLCLSYAVLSVVIVSALDARAGVHTLVEARSLPPELRTFARLSVWGNTPAKVFLAALDESRLPDGCVALIRLNYTTDGLGFLAGSGPKRRAFYDEMNVDTTEGFLAAIDKLHDYVVQKQCRWLLVDARLWRLRHFLDASPDTYHTMVTDNVYGVLYHVERSDPFGLRRSKSDLEGVEFEENSTGWHGFERNQIGGRMISGRWMSPNSAAIWWNVPSVQNSVLTLKILNEGSVSPVHSKSIELSVDGHVIGSQAPIETSELRYRVPANALKVGANRFSFSCDGYEAPTSGIDQRKRCVFVESVSLEPAVD